MSTSCRWKPGVPDLVFGIVLFMGLVGGRTAFLNDPGTFWHVQLGREILQTGRVPHADSFTFSRGGQAWVDQSWAFDLGLATIVDRWGWSGAVAATALILAWTYASLARGLCRDGNMPLVAGVTAVLVAGIGSVHFLTRPHLFTFAFTLWTFRACKSYHESGGRALWSLPPIMVAWANLHGGFLAGPVIVATAALGHAVAGRWDAARRRRVAGFLGVFALCGLAPLVNPYGVGLYRHVTALLFTSGVTKLINEYQPSPFGHIEAMVLEWFILAFIALPAFSRTRVGRYELTHIVVWLHLALGAIRQAPLFALAASTGLARLMNGLLSPSADPKADEALGRWSSWPALTSGALAVSVVVGVTWGELNPHHWPLRALPVLDRQPIAMRMFHEQDWGGMIESECHPHRPTYLDDRFELFGKQAILDYLEALTGGPAWDALDRRERFDLAWLRPDGGLARRLMDDPAWMILHRDKVSVLLRRKDAKVDGPRMSDSHPRSHRAASTGTPPPPPS